MGFKVTRIHGGERVAIERLADGKRTFEFQCADTEARRLYASLHALYGEHTRPDAGYDTSAPWWRQPEPPICEPVHDAPAPPDYPTQEAVDLMIHRLLVVCGRAICRQVLCLFDVEKTHALRPDQRARFIETAQDIIRDAVRMGATQN
jgi:hypothetical protein